MADKRGAGGAHVVAIQIDPGSVFAGADPARGTCCP